MLNHNKLLPKNCYFVKIFMKIIKSKIHIHKNESANFFFFSTNIANAVINKPPYNYINVAKTRSLFVRFSMRLKNIKGRPKIKT